MDKAALHVIFEPVLEENGSRGEEIVFYKKGIKSWRRDELSQHTDPT